jgi:hypothetical protein
MPPVLVPKKAACRFGLNQFKTEDYHSLQNEKDHTIESECSTVKG